MKKILTTLLLLLSVVAVEAKYVDKIGEYKAQIDLTKKYGLKSDNAQSDQSAKVQRAIDEVSAAGGGVIYIPKGIYSFCGISMDSNVHIIIDKEVEIIPFKHESQQSGSYVFQLTGRPPKNAKGKKASQEESFIENCSIRCKQSGEYFTIDYSHVPACCNFRRINVHVLAFKCGTVRNFMVEGMSVKDNWTTLCAATFYPAKVEGCDKWEVYRPTSGLIRNFKSTNSSGGYGLAQLHGGYDLHFENLSTTNGGITFRLETGAGGHYGGVDNMTAENIYCENGIAPVIMGPHTAKNGTVHIKNITAVSCRSAYQCGPGYNDGKDNSNTAGYFSNDSTIENIHAVYGNNAPVSKKLIGTIYTPEQIAKFTFDQPAGLFRGASVYVVIDTSGDGWSPNIKNITAEGFPEGTELTVTKEKDARSDYAKVLAKYPIWDTLPDYVKNQKKKSEVVRLKP